MQVKVCSQRACVSYKQQEIITLYVQYYAYVETLSLPSIIIRLHET